MEQIQVEKIRSSDSHSTHARCSVRVGGQFESPPRDPPHTPEFGCCASRRPRIRNRPTGRRDFCADVERCFPEGENGSSVNRANHPVSDQLVPGRAPDPETVEIFEKQQAILSLGHRNQARNSLRHAPNVDTTAPTKRPLCCAGSPWVNLRNRVGKKVEENGGLVGGDGVGVTARLEHGARSRAIGHAVLHDHRSVHEHPLHSERSRRES